MNIQHSSQNESIIAAASILLLPLLLSFLIAVAGFALGIPLQGWYLPASIIATAIVVISRNPGRESLRTIIVTLMLMALWLIPATWLNDSSYDGNTYHQGIIARLLLGWNPYYEILDTQQYELWIQHYPKAMEIVAAMPAMLTGHIESGKAINGFIIAGCALLLFKFLRQFLPQLSKKAAAITTIVATCNPVGISQLLTFHIDFTAYYFIILATIFACRIVRHNSAGDILLLIGAIIFSAATKATTLLYVGITLIAIVIWLLYHKNLKSACRISLISVAAAIAGFFLICYHPFIINWTHFGHPLFPLMGENSIDIMTHNTPEIYHGHNRFANFLISAKSIVLPYYDSREGGFGILGILALILSACTITISRNGKLIYAAIIAFASCFLFEQTWWARYIPQLWIVVAAGTIAAFIIKTKSKIWYSAILIAVILNTCVVIVKITGSAIKLTLIRERIYNTCSKTDKTYEIINLNEQTALHFSERGINVRQAKTIPADTTICGMSYYCYPENPVNSRILMTPDEIESLHLNDKIGNLWNWQEYITDRQTILYNFNPE